MKAMPWGFLALVFPFCAAFAPRAFMHGSQFCRACITQSPFSTSSISATGSY